MRRPSFSATKKMRRTFFGESKTWLRHRNCWFAAWYFWHHGHYSSHLAHGKHPIR